MFRYYKVPVYALQDDLVSYDLLDYLVVTPHYLFAKELLTGYYSIEILTNKMVDGSKLKLAPGNTLEIKKKIRDVALFTLKEEFVPKNLVTESFLDSYINNFDTSKFNTIYKKINDRKFKILELLDETSEKDKKIELEKELNNIIIKLAKIK